MFWFCRKHGLRNHKKTPDVVILASFLVVVATCAIFTHWPVLSGRALSFDDSMYLEKNELVQNPSWRSARRFLSEVLEPSTVTGYYQPLAMISLMLDYAMGGRADNLLPFHITSLCLHVFNTSLIIVFLYVLFGRVWPAVVGGLLFGLHPLTVEPIAWLAERKTLLASFFALWCMIIYVRYARGGNRKLLIGSAVLYVLALMSKPTTTPLPVLLLLLDFWPLGRLNRRALLEKVPLFVIMLIFGIITVISQGRTATITMPYEYSYVRIPLVVCHNIVFYLYKIFWPVKLSSHYPFPIPLSISDSMILAGVIGTSILLPTLLISLRWTRALLTGWLFFFVGIFPTIGIIGFTNVIASDRHVYLPSVGLLMVVVWFLCWLRRYVSSLLASRIIIVIFILVAAVSESVATRHYLVHWQESEGHYRYMLRLAPGAPLVHLNLANTILKMKRYDEAIEHYEKAIKIHRNYVDAHYNLGIALGLEGRYDEAIEEYQRVLRLRERHWRARFRLADALVQVGQVEEAIGHYRKVIEIKPNNTEVHSNFGLALVKKGEIDEAIKHYERALEINPDSVEVLNNLGNALVKRRRFAEAVLHLKEALSLEPSFAETYYNLGNSLRQMGRNDEAVLYYREGLQLQPNNSKAHYRLGLVLVRLKEYDEAVVHYQRAIELKPEFAEAYYNLGVIFAKQGEIDRAIEEFREVLRIRPADAEMHCNLGILLFRKGSIDEAIEEFRTALRLEPDMSKAREQLEAALAGKGAGE